MKKQGFLKSILAVGLSAACLCGVVGCSSEEVEDTVAATVNGVEIYESTITTYIESFRTTYSLDDDDTWASWMITNDYTVESVRAEVIDSYIERELMLAYAEEQGISIDSDEITAYVDIYVEYLITLMGSEDAWEEALDDAGLTEEQYRTELAVQLVYSNLLTVMATEDDIPEEDLLEYATQYATNYDGAKHSLYIVLSLDDEETANEVLELITSGEISFEDAIADYSLDEDYDAGWDLLSSYDDEYQAALDELAEGKMSGLVEIDDYYYIILCDEEFIAPTTTDEDGEETIEVTDTSQIPEEWLEDITETLLTLTQENAYDEWVEEAYESADIEIADMPSNLSYYIDLSLYETEEEEVDTTPAATVNDIDIYESTITTYIETFRTNYGLDDDEDWAEWLITYGYTAETVRADVIDSYIERALVLDYADELGISIDSSVIDSYVEYMVELLGSEELWEAMLEASGMTEDEYRSELEFELIYEEFIEALFSEDDLTDEDLLEYATMYAESYDGAKRSSHILFDADDEETAQEVLEMLQNGEITFEEAAAEYSTDSSADDGGDVGWDKVTTFVDEYQEALDELEVGEMSGLVTSDYGIHIILCTDEFVAPTTTDEDGNEVIEVTDLSVMPEDWLEDITESALEAAQDAAYEAWLEEALASATIEIADMPEDVSYNIDLSEYETEDEDADADETTEDEDADVEDADAEDETTEDETAEDADETTEDAADEDDAEASDDASEDDAEASDDADETSEDEDTEE